MREIKFRAWNNKDKFNKAYMVYSDDCNCCVWTWYEDCPVMQYTGLKDKNGKEIYEGDILQYKTIFQSKKNTPKMFVTVKLDNLLDGLFDLQYDEYSNYNCDRNTLEVIGNIYENPELLEYN